jgi:hypothetical protein
MKWLTTTETWLIREHHASAMAGKYTDVRRGAVWVRPITLCSLLMLLAGETIFPGRCPRTGKAKVEVGMMVRGLAGKTQQGEVGRECGGGFSVDSGGGSR